MMMLPIYWVTALHEEGNVVLQKYHYIAGGIKHTVYEAQAIVLVEKRVFYWSWLLWLLNRALSRKEQGWHLPVDFYHPASLPYTRVAFINRSLIMLSSVKKEYLHVCVYVHV